MTDFLELFQYGFMLRAVEAGLIVAFLAPLVGIFLVLRRYSLIADSLAHVSLAGIAVGLLMKVNPLFTALAAALVSALSIETLRASRRLFGESALSIFLSGSLALALVLLSLGNGFSVNLFAFLFGSILTVSQPDVYLIAALAGVSLVVVGLFYKELVFISFDEEAAKVAGLPVRAINLLLVALAAFVITLSIPLVGALLVGALIVIPVATALQFRLGFGMTIALAQAFSMCSVFCGILVSFYLDVSASGAIVLIMLALFALSFALMRRS
jgi:zinc transport system permease protein